MVKPSIIVLSWVIGMFFVLLFSESAVTVFVKPPSFEVNEQRLRARGTEDEAEIEQRLEVARAQLEQADQFDYVVVNDDLERAVLELDELVSAQIAGRLSRT